jgi:hypothetical protein
MLNRRLTGRISSFDLCSTSCLFLRNKTSMFLEMLLSMLSISSRVTFLLETWVAKWEGEEQYRTNQLKYVYGLWTAPKPEIMAIIVTPITPTLPTYAKILIRGWSTPVPNWPSREKIFSRENEQSNHNYHHTWFVRRKLSTHTPERVEIECVSRRQ